MLIPKVIYQTWFGTKEPPTEMMSSWKQRNPDYEYRLIRNETGWGELQPLFDEMAELNGKSDLIRSAVLRGSLDTLKILYGSSTGGGNYGDADVELIKPLPESWRSCEAWAVWDNEIAGVRGGLNSCLLGSRPGSAYFTDVVKQLFKCDMRRPAVTEIGPGLLSRVAKGHPELDVFPSRAACPFHYERTLAPGNSPVYGIHWWTGTKGVERDAQGRWLDPPKWEQAPEEPTHEGPRPTVSVIIPCWKQSQYLSEAVASVQSQTMTDWEVVIVASDPESLRVAKSLAGDKIKVIDAPPKGLGDARNVGIEASHGHYILPLDADDRLLPEHLERVLRATDGSELEIVATWIQEFGDATNIWKGAPWDGLLEQNTNACCALFTRRLWDVTGGYDVCLLGIEDWDFWIRCSEHGPRYTCLSEPLFQYRVHSESMMRWDAKNNALRYHVAMMRLRHPSLYDAGRLELDKTVFPAAPYAFVRRLYERATLFPWNHALRCFVAMTKKGLPSPEHPSAAVISQCGCAQCRAEREALMAMRRR